MKKICLKVVCLVAFVSLMLAILQAFALAQTVSKLPKSAAIATHPKGTSFSAIGGGLAKVISAHTPITAVDRPYTGYLTWIPLVNKGSVDMGVGVINDFYFAYRGIGDYKKKHNNLRHISMGTLFRVGFIARANSGIKTVADLRGKRATIDPSTMITKMNILTIIRAAGLDPDKDVTLIPVAGVAEGLELFMDGRVDAAFASIGMGKVKEAAAKFGGICWVSVCGSEDDAAARFIRKNLPAMDVVFIKAGSAPEVNHDFWFLESPITLGTHKGFSDEAAYQITKALWEHQDELAPIHPMLKGWGKSMVSEKAVIPYHSGAIRFYKEVGAWSDKMEQLQKKLLSE